MPGLTGVCPSLQSPPPSHRHILYPCCIPQTPKLVPPNLGTSNFHGGWRAWAHPTEALESLFGPCPLVSADGDIRGWGIFVATEQ